MRKLTGTLARSVAMAFVILGGGTIHAELVEIDDPQFDSDSVLLHRNTHWSLETDRSYAYIAESEDGCEYNKFTVLPETRTIEGVDVRVVRDLAWELEDDEGECDDPVAPENAVLVEDTLDFYAVDVDDNLHYFGEETWSIDDESDEDDPLCTDAGAWLHGRLGAEEGILMLAEPFSGARYQQEYWEDEAEDWGKVNRTNATLDDWEDCDIIKEWTPLEPGSVEKKYYCEGVLVFIQELHGRTLEVEYVGDSFGFELPGEMDAFPALEAVGSCTMPD